MNNADVKKAIQDYQDALELALDRKKQACDEFIEEHCPHKIGDVIQCTGYSFQGKSVRIERINVDITWGNLRFQYHGRVLRKDYSDSLHTTKWEEIIRDENP